MTVADEVYGEDDPIARPPGHAGFRASGGGSTSVLHLARPLAPRADVHLAGHGDEPVVTAESYRRPLTLPVALARHHASGARVEQGGLQVRFEEAVT